MIQTEFVDSTQATGSYSGSSPVCNKDFVRSPWGIVKLIHIILSCIVLICVAATPTWSSFSSGGWANFVAAITLIITSIFYIFYLFDLLSRLSGPWVLIEFVTLLVSVFFWFVTFCVGAANNGLGGGAIATAFFSFLAMVSYIIDVALRFRVGTINGRRTIVLFGAAHAVPPDDEQQSTQRPVVQDPAYQSDPADDYALS